MKNSACCRWVPFLLVVLLGDLNVIATSWPLGTLTTNSNTDPSCPSGFTCHGFAVSCPGVSNSIQVFWALAPHQGAARGLVLFFTGCDGMGWWSTQSPELSALVAELRSCAVYRATAVP